MNETEPLKILGFAALVLASRILTWLSLAGGLAIFGYAVIFPSQDRTIAAALFALLVFIPCLMAEKRPAPKRIAPRQQQPVNDEVNYG